MCNFAEIVNDSFNFELLLMVISVRLMVLDLKKSETEVGRSCLIYM